MKNLLTHFSIREYSIIAAFLIAILLFGLLTCHSCRAIEKVAAADSTYYWKNKAGNAVASQKKTAEDFAVINKKLSDSIAKAYHTKPKLVKEYIVIHNEAKTDLPPVNDTKAADYFPPLHLDGEGPGVRCPPQIKNLRQSFANNYYKADVQLGDSSYLHLSAKDTITIVWHITKAGNIFHRREYLQADISNANPDVKTNNLQIYRMKDRSQKRFGIGFQLGYGYSNSFHPSLYVGAGLNYNLIRF